jgi:hypothetical protein
MITPVLLFVPPWVRTLAASTVLAALAVACGAERAPEDAATEAARGTPTILPVPAASDSGQPHLAVSPTGEAVLSWLEPADGGGHALKFSRLDGGRWGSPRAVTSGADLLANWADFPSVEPITSSMWIAHWLKMAPDSFASYDIEFAVSADGGETWSEGALLNDDGYLTEHGFVSLFPWDDAIGAVWLDGRRIAEQFELEEFDPDGPPVGMSLRYARVGYDGGVLERGELDELACDCCQTDAALTDSGPVVVYRDRTPDEIRDNVVRRHADGEWQPGVTLGPDDWRIEGCPVNGPAIAARGEEVVAAWFTAPGNVPKTRFARSGDGGATFDPPIEIDGQGSFGHVDVVLLEHGAAIVSWWRRGEGVGTALMARRIERSGELGAPRLIADNATAQPLDVPQMIETDGTLVFAWTDARDMTVKSASVSVELQ